MTTLHLSDYVEIRDTPESVVSSGSVEVGGRWLCLKVPLGQWPMELQKQWQQELFFLFPTENRVIKVDARDCLTLCHEIKNCPRKLEGEEEDRSCSHYSRGICIPATSVANDLRPLSFGTIGAFNGISKQRVQQIYCSAQRKVIRAAARDPILREYYTALGVRPENMPDPRKMAENMEELLA